MSILGTMEWEVFETKALALSPPERARLASRLIASLDELNEDEHERLWVRESERRYAAYRNGEVTAKPLDQAMRDIRARLG